MLAIILLIFGISARLIAHAPNFTPVIAIALFGGVYLNKKYAIILPLALMIISDLFIGMHNTVAFTWGSMAAVALMGLWVRKNKRPSLIFSSSVCAAVFYFIVTNFGVWLTALYPNTLAGLANCYTLAIPFFRSTLLSTLAYGAVLFGSYEYIAHRVKDTRLAHVLLEI